jgi:hypothetical protein
MQFLYTSNHVALDWQSEQLTMQTTQSAHLALSSQTLPRTAGRSSTDDARLNPVRVPGPGERRTLGNPSLGGS